MHFDYLASDGIHLVDAQVTETQVNAGWVYVLGGLSRVETVTDGEVSLPIRIHPNLQRLNDVEFFLSNDVIEFMRCQP